MIRLHRKIWLEITGGEISGTLMFVNVGTFFDFVFDLKLFEKSRKFLKKCWIRALRVASEMVEQY